MTVPMRRSAHSPRSCLFAALLSGALSISFAMCPIVASAESSAAAALESVAAAQAAVPGDLDGVDAQLLEELREAEDAAEEAGDRLGSAKGIGAVWASEDIAQAEESAAVLEDVSERAAQSQLDNTRARLAEVASECAAELEAALVVDVPDSLEAAMGDVSGLDAAALRGLAEDVRADTDAAVADALDEARSSAEEALAGLPSGVFPGIESRLEDAIAGSDVAELRAAAETAGEAAGGIWRVSYRVEYGTAAGAADGACTKWADRYWIAHSWSSNGKRIAALTTGSVVELDGHYYRYVDEIWRPHGTYYDSYSCWCSAYPYIGMQTCSGPNGFVVKRLALVR